jgi:hypothetical protein
MKPIITRLLIIAALSSALGIIAAILLARYSFAEPPAAFVRPIPTPTHKIFPPPGFDHQYDGDLTIKIVDTLEELHRICQIDNPKLLACSKRNEWSCIIVMVKDEIMRQRNWTTGLLLRHEIGHCNGWGADHAGERSISFPTIHWAHPNARVRL